MLPSSTLYCSRKSSAGEFGYRRFGYPLGLTRNEWNNVALSVGAKFVNIEVSCSNKDEHKSRLETRTSTVPELVEPTWKEIQDRDYHPWDQDRILIETSHKSVGASFDELISILQERLLIGKI